MFHNHESSWILNPAVEEERHDATLQGEWTILDHCARSQSEVGTRLRLHCSVSTAGD